MRQFLIIALICIGNLGFAQTQAEMNRQAYPDSVDQLQAIDYGNRNLMYVKKDGSILMTAQIRKDHRIFGYRDKDEGSEKMILLSIFTNEVEANPFACEYGAYYDISGIKDFELHYGSTEDQFVKILIVKG